MKRFISGVVVGMLISSTIAFAATYTAHQAGFKVLVNGKEFTSDPPPLVVEGRTYLPLRAMGEALGVPVEWNAELQQAEVGEVPEENQTDDLKDPEILTSKKDKTYIENNNIINMGYVIGKDAYETADFDNCVAYFYDISDQQVNPLRAYEYVLDSDKYIITCDDKTLNAISKNLDSSYDIIAEIANNKLFVLFERN